MSVKKSINKNSVETLKFKRPDDSKLLFEIIDLNKPDREIPATYHRHDFFEIVIILKGSTKHLVDFKEYIVSMNEIMVIPQNSIHQGRFKEQLTGYIILFTKDFFTCEQYKYISGLEIFNASYGDQLMRFNENEWNEIYPLLTVLVQEYQIQKKTANNTTLRLLVLAFNTKLNILLNNGDNILLSTDVMRSFFDLLENNYLKEHSVAFYGNKLHITPKKLTRTLAQATGKTTVNLVTERLILEAKRELLFQKKRLKKLLFRHIKKIS